MHVVSRDLREAVLERLPRTEREGPRRGVQGAARRLSPALEALLPYLGGCSPSEALEAPSALAPRSAAPELRPLNTADPLPPPRATEAALARRSRIGGGRRAAAADWRVPALLRAPPLPAPAPRAALPRLRLSLQSSLPPSQTSSSQPEPRGGCCAAAAGGSAGGALEKRSCSCASPRAAAHLLDVRSKTLGAWPSSRVSWRAASVVPLVRKTAARRNFERRSAILSSLRMPAARARPAPSRSVLEYFSVPHRRYSAVRRSTLAIWAGVICSASVRCRDLARSSMCIAMP